MPGNERSARTICGWILVSCSSAASIPGVVNTSTLSEDNAATTDFSIAGSSFTINIFNPVSPEFIALPPSFQAHKYPDRFPINLRNLGQGATVLSGQDVRCNTRAC